VARIALAVLPAVLLGSCTPATVVGRKGSDQEIVRDVLLRFRKDPRLERVDVTCVDRVLTLEGRVDDRLAAEDALRIAREVAPAAQVLSRIVILPR